MVGFHCDKVNNSLKSISLSNRKLNRNYLVAQSFFYWFKRHEEVCSHFIHLICEYESRNSIFISLSPNRFCLRFCSLRNIKQSNSTIKHSKRSLYFYCKIHVTWGINHIYLDVMPKTCRSSRSNSNTSFFFLLHPIHISFSIVSFTDLVLLPCVIQNSLSCCGFTSINMRHDTDIPYLVQRFFVVCHQYKTLK